MKKELQKNGTFQISSTAEKAEFPREPEKTLEQ